MRKSTKRILIIFIIGIVGVGATIGIMLGTRVIASEDDSAVVAIGDDIKEIELITNKAHVKLIESDKREIHLKLNLWADIDMDVEDIAVVSFDEGVLKITETAPQNTFLGVFEQPYEIIITIYAPADIIDNIDD